MTPEQIAEAKGAADSQRQVRLRKERREDAEECAAVRAKERKLIARRTAALGKITELVLAAVTKQAVVEHIKRDELTIEVDIEPSVYTILQGTELKKFYWHSGFVTAGHIQNLVSKRDKLTGWIDYVRGSGGELARFIQRLEEGKIRVFFEKGMMCTLNKEWLRDPCIRIIL